MLRLLSAVMTLLVGAEVLSEPVVITGSMVSQFLGKSLKSIRMTDGNGDAVPFQIDEVTSEGEYVLPCGEEPNTDKSNGILDERDEIVFLWEDATILAGNDDKARGRSEQKVDQNRLSITVVHGEEKRIVYLCDDPGSPLSPKRYIEYDPANEALKTPYFYAIFGRDRFHFVRAGVMDFTTGEYLDLTNELRIEIYMRMFWGLIPIKYSEDNMVCLVKRYKAGPIRLIRRGDFHLNLGLGFKASRAVVNQICYPYLVSVPVHVHVPVRLKSFFSHAHIEMTPVITEKGRKFSFNVPDRGVSIRFDNSTPLDTLLEIIPDNIFFRVDDGVLGYGWLLQTTIERSCLEGSGYLFSRPSPRGGVGHCGFRLTLKDLPRGYYDITNWVLFPRKGISDLETNCDYIRNPATVMISGARRVYLNQIGSMVKPKGAASRGR